MAASSSSVLVPSSSISSLGSFTYQVFLSFRGKDTRQSFIGHLSKALEDARIHTFIDDEEMKAGDHISETLLKAIKESMYCVVILSKGYADSKWCLKELAAMFEHNKEIIPVFFHVEPSDVRHQKGPSFEQSFKNHEVYNPAYVEKWRQAMTKVGQRKGFHISDQSSKKEAEWIQEIVERVRGCSDYLMLPIADYPVGMDSRVEEVMKLLSIGEGGVKMVGIYGMKGIGKTTLAKEIYNRLQGRFEKAIYMEGIKDGVKKDGLPKLQQQFISKAFKHGNLDIYNSTEGTVEISMRFRHTRLLAILDDVDHRDQLKALAGACDWFGEGTRILITTRDTHLLNAHGVERQYEVRQLNRRDSLRLFSWHAFNNEEPSEEYMEISQQVAEVTGGLPLALEVVGSSLTEENNKRIWKQMATRLRRPKYDDINGAGGQRISYDGLDQEEQKIFLDVACFFIDEKKERVIDTLRGCDFKATESSIDALLQKGLLKVDKFGTLRMDDLLQDMGRKIGSRSRLWAQQEVWEVLDGRTGTPEIEGIVCRKIPEREEESLDVEALTNMSNLRLLLLDDIHLKGDFSKMPTSLRSLRWKHCSMKVLPDNFNIEKIGFLDLSMGNIIQVWSDSYMSKKKVFTNLKLLDLSECKGLTKLPDFSCSLNLEKLYLQNCSKLVSIPDSICLLKNLVYLDIAGCRLMKELPNEIGKLEKLIELYLRGTKIDALPYSVRSLQKLEVLSLNGCEKLKMPASGEVKAELLDFVANLGSLRELSLWQYMLEKIPDQLVGKLTNLEKLLVRGALRELPNTIVNLNKLCELDLSCSSIEELPESIGFMQNLKTLRLEKCKMMKCLPESIGSLTRLEEIKLTDCSTLRELPSSIGHLNKLKVLLLGCVPIAELPKSIQLLESLTLLDITYCNELETVLPLWELKSLQCLSVGSESEVDGEQVGNLVVMRGKSPHSQECRMIQYVYSTAVREVWYLSVTGVGNQKNVMVLVDVNGLGRQNRRWLSLIFPNDFVFSEYKCQDWSPNLGGVLSTGIPKLYCIRVIDLSDSDMEELDESIVHLPHLKQLNLHGCIKLKCLPISFGCLTLLTYLKLLGCKSLSTLPNSIGNLTRLEVLELMGCASLKLLPNSIGNLKRLRLLNLGYSGIEVLPDSFPLLESLQWLSIIGCYRLQGRLPLWEMKCLHALAVGDEVGGKDVGEIPDGITHYSQQAKEYRRIKHSNIQDEQRWVKLELSIWVEGCQEREIDLVVFLPCEGWKGQSWLRHIFPKDFTPQYETRARSEASASPSSLKGSHLTNLEKLKVGGALRELLNTILNLHKQCELDLSGSNIELLPESIGFMQNLKTLRLLECKMLKCLPESIGSLTKLEELTLTGCTSLSTLPNSIGNLTMLGYVNLCGCESLSTLPNSIRNLTRLEQLLLGDCTSLKLLPNSIGNLKRLWWFNLSHSGIEVLPHSFPLLESLEHLIIVGCYRLQGRLPLWEMKCLRSLAVGDEVGEKDVGEIPDGITHYSQQAKEYRRIHHSNIQDEQHWVKLELSIWVEGSREREIELNVFPPCEGRKGQSWLRRIFPKDFTPQ